jgi:hypothetical protein
MTEHADPTGEAYAELGFAFDYFNLHLFENRLSRPLFTLPRERNTLGYHSRKRFVSRKSKAMVDELAMNPAYFGSRPMKLTLSTVVHEMAHQWQDDFGKPGRGRYHNKEWAQKMLSLGLCPTDTGAPGGKMTGDYMTHYVIKDGPFDKLCDQLLKEPFKGQTFQLSWFDRYRASRPLGESPTASPLAPEASTKEDGDHTTAAPEGPEKAYVDDAELAELIDLVETEPTKPGGKSNRCTFQCPICQQMAWGKPALTILCGVGGCRQAVMLRIDPKRQRRG